MYSSESEGDDDNDDMFMGISSNKVNNNNNRDGVGSVGGHSSHSSGSQSRRRNTLGMGTSSIIVPGGAIGGNGIYPTGAGNGNTTGKGGQQQPTSLLKNFATEMIDDFITNDMSHRRMITFYHSGKMMERKVVLREMDRLEDLKKKLKKAFDLTMFPILTLPLPPGYRSVRGGGIIERPNFMLIENETTWEYAKVEWEKRNLSYRRQAMMELWDNLILGLNSPIVKTMEDSGSCLLEFCFANENIHFFNEECLGRILKNLNEQKVGGGSQLQSIYIIVKVFWKLTEYPGIKKRLVKLDLIPSLLRIVNYFLTNQVLSELEQKIELACVSIFSRCIQMSSAQSQSVEICEGLMKIMLRKRIIITDDLKAEGDISYNAFFAAEGLLKNIVSSSGNTHILSGRKFIKKLSDFICYFEEIRSKCSKVPKSLVGILKCVLYIMYAMIKDTNNYDNISEEQAISAWNAYLIVIGGLLNIELEEEDPDAPIPICEKLHKLFNKKEKKKLLAVSTNSLWGIVSLLQMKDDNVDRPSSKEFKRVRTSEEFLKQMGQNIENSEEKKKQKWRLLDFKSCWIQKISVLPLVFRELTTWKSYRVLNGMLQSKSETEYLTGAGITSIIALEKQLPFSFNILGNVLKLLNDPYSLTTRRNAASSFARICYSQTISCTQSTLATNLKPLWLDFCMNFIENNGIEILYQCVEYNHDRNTFNLQTEEIQLREFAAIAIAHIYYLCPKVICTKRYAMKLVTLLACLDSELILTYCCISIFSLGRNRKNSETFSRYNTVEALYSVLRRANEEILIAWCTNAIRILCNNKRNSKKLGDLKGTINLLLQKSLQYLNPKYDKSVKLACIGCIRCCFEGNVVDDIFEKQHLGYTLIHTILEIIQNHGDFEFYHDIIRESYVLLGQARQNKDFRIIMHKLSKKKYFFEDMLVNLLMDPKTSCKNVGISAIHVDVVFAICKLSTQRESKVQFGVNGGIECIIELLVTAVDIQEETAELYFCEIYKEYINLLELVLKLLETFRNLVTDSSNHRKFVTLVLPTILALSFSSVPEISVESRKILCNVSMSHDPFVRMRLYRSKLVAASEKLARIESEETGKSENGAKLSAADKNMVIENLRGNLGCIWEESELFASLSNDDPNEPWTDAQKAKILKSYSLGTPETTKIKKKKKAKEKEQYHDKNLRLNLKPIEGLGSTARANLLTESPSVFAPIPMEWNKKTILRRSILDVEQSGPTVKGKPLQRHEEKVEEKEGSDKGRPFTPASNIIMGDEIIEDDDTVYEHFLKHSRWDPPSEEFRAKHKESIKTYTPEATIKFFRFKHQEGCHLCDDMYQHYEDSKGKLWHCYKIDTDPNLNYPFNVIDPGPFPASKPIDKIDRLFMTIPDPPKGLKIENEDLSSSLTARGRNETDLASALDDVSQITRDEATTAMHTNRTDFTEDSSDEDNDENQPIGQGQLSISYLMKGYRYKVLPECDPPEDHVLPTIKTSCKQFYNQCPGPDRCEVYGLYSVDKTPFIVMERAELNKINYTKERWDWKLENSVFQDRLLESDSQSFYNPKAIRTAVGERDWRIFVDRPRVRTYIERADKRTEISNKWEHEKPRLQQIIVANYDFIVNTYIYYTTYPPATKPEDYVKTEMQLISYNQFIEDQAVWKDDATKNEMTRLFPLINLEDKKLDGAYLYRHEFAELFIKVAILCYHQDPRTRGAASDCVNLLMYRVKTRLPKALYADQDQYRDIRLYNVDNNDIFEKYGEVLLGVYTVYTQMSKKQAVKKKKGKEKNEKPTTASTATTADTGDANESSNNSGNNDTDNLKGSLSNNASPNCELQMSLEDWERLMAHTCNFTSSSFTRQHLKFVFQWTRMVTIEEQINSRTKERKQSTMSFVDFQEALMRVADALSYVEFNKTLSKSKKREDSHLMYVSPKEYDVAEESHIVLENFIEMFLQKLCIHHNGELRINCKGHQLDGQLVCTLEEYWPVDYEAQGEGENDESSSKKNSPRIEGQKSPRSPRLSIARGGEEEAVVKDKAKSGGKTKIAI